MNDKTDNWLDEDGYPTDAALETIRTWPWNNDGWFDFIEEIWWAADWGWKEAIEPSQFDDEKLVRKYYLSTGGWSGNESIISAMQENSWLWNWYWEQSRRGGHYIFEEKISGE